MPLTADSIIDRAQLKAQIKKWRAIALLAVVALLLICTRSLAPAEIKKQDYIARVAIKDIITEDRKRNEVLTGLANNKHVKAVIVHIDSPGGTVVGGEELYTALRDISARKPVVAVLGTIATSGGYMTAIAADYIVSHRGTITGSIGVLLQTAEVTEAAKKLGIELLSFKSSPLKGTPSPFEHITPQAAAAIQSSINDSYAMFVSMVKERRKLSQEEVLKLSDGRIYTGNQAFQYKLVDALGSEKEAINWLQKSKQVPALHVKDVDLTEKKPYWKELLNSTSFFGYKFSAIAQLSLDGMLSIWHAR